MNPLAISLWALAACLGYIATESLLGIAYALAITIALQLTGLIYPLYLPVSWLEKKMEALSNAIVRALQPKPKRPRYLRR